MNGDVLLFLMYCLKNKLVHKCEFIGLCCDFFRHGLRGITRKLRNEYTKRNRVDPCNPCLKNHITE